MHKFKPGDKVVVTGHKGYNEYEPRKTLDDAPKIGKAYTIDERSQFKGELGYFLEETNRGIYEIDLDYASKLARVLK